MSLANTVRSILTALLGVVLVLVAGELVVRTWIESPFLLQPDARFGWRYPPHATVVHSSEGYSVHRTNSLGLFDDEPRVPRPRLRALLVGDSYAEALQVPRGQGFADVAERLVPGLEVMNAGLSGHDLLDHTEWAELYTDRIRPDVTVVQLSDVNLEDLLRPAALARMAHPPVPGVPDPPPPEGFTMRLLRGWLAPSALARLSWRRLGLLLTDQRARLSRRFQEASARPRPAGVTAVGTDPRLPAVLDSLHARIARTTPRVIYVFIPHLDYFTPGAPASHPGAVALVHGFAARHGLALVDVTDAFRAEFARTGQPVHGFSNSVIASGHINSAGHRVVGEALAHALEVPAP